MNCCVCESKAIIFPKHCEIRGSDSMLAYLGERPKCICELGFFFTQGSKNALMDTSGKKTHFLG